MGEKSGSYNSKRSKFLSDFSAIFHPRNGKFGDKELRKKVYDMLFPSLRKGTNYKSLYRKTAMALHPDTEANSECTKEELEFVFKYFQEHMTHPNEM